MATFNNPIIATTDLTTSEHAAGRVGFLATRPDVDTVYAEYKQPGTLWAYYRSFDGQAELYMVDPSGYKFMTIR